MKLLLILTFSFGFVLCIPWDQYPQYSQYPQYPDCPGYPDNFDHEHPDCPAYPDNFDYDYPKGHKGNLGIN